MSTKPATVTFPITLAEITDEGLRNIENGVRAERIRRALARHQLAKPAVDADDAALESLPPEALARLADTLGADDPMRRPS